MRTALLLVSAGLLLSLAACGDEAATLSTGKAKSTKTPAAGSNQDHDPNAPSNEPADPANPNATTPPSTPTTPGTSTGQIAVALSTATPATDLGTSIDITVTVTPESGFRGDAELTATGLPTGATAVFSPASVTLNTTAVTSKMTITVPVTAVPSASGASSSVVVKAASGATNATANASFKVNPQINMTIPLNADALRAAVGTRYVDGWAGPALGTAPAALQTQQGNPINVVVKNADSAAHIVHGNAGFVHGDTANPVQPGATDSKTRTLNPGVNTSGYLHDGNNGTSESFRISVNQAQ